MLVNWCLKPAQWCRKQAPFILLASAVAWLACGHRYKVPDPPIGTYVVILTFLAAVITIWPSELEHRPWAKAAWVVLFGVLAALEIGNLYKDRTEHDDQQIMARKREDNRFAGILKQNQDQFSSTMTSMQQLWSEMTGGNSYPLFNIDSPVGPLDTDIPGLKKGQLCSNALITLVGNFPLHNVSVSTFGPQGWLNPVDYGTVEAHELGRLRQSIPLVFFPYKPKQLFHLWTSASNGSYQQDILFLKMDQKWLWAARLYKAGRKKPIRIWTAPGFPKDQLNSDWSK